MEITREQLIEKLQHIISVASGFPESEKAQIDLELARIALASLEAEAAIHRWRRVTSEPYGPCPWHYGDFIGFSKPVDGIEDEYFYSAPPAPAPANAEPVAWLWSHRKHPSEVTLVRPEDDERADGAHWSGWSCQALYAAPPAPAAMKDHQIRELVNELRDIAVEYHGTEQLRERIARTIRAAMLQGAEPVTPAYKLPEGWVAVPVEPTDDMIVNGFESEPDESFSDAEEWEAYDAMSGCQQAAHRAKLCWSAMIAAAPKPDVR